MDEVVNHVAQKTGIEAEKVRQALTAAVEFIKGKLPPQFASQVDMFVKGGGAGGPRSAAGMMGGLLGGK
ncbi:MAG: hypothetical protein U0871_21680 [Gemmataceae bacterium]